MAPKLKSSPFPLPRALDSEAPTRALTAVKRAAIPVSVAVGVAALAADTWGLLQNDDVPPCPRMSAGTGSTSFVDKAEAEAKLAFYALKAKFIKPAPALPMAGAMMPMMPMPPPSSTVSIGPPPSTPPAP